VVNKINEVDFIDLSEHEHFGDIYEQILNDLKSPGNAGEYYIPRAVTAFGCAEMTGVTIRHWGIGPHGWCSRTRPPSVEKWTTPLFRSAPCRR